mgnify:CR=1 FL=1
MAKSSGKKRQDSIYTAVTGTILLIGLWAIFHFNLTNIYYIIGLVLFAVVIGALVSSLTPDGKGNKNRNKSRKESNPPIKNAQKKSKVAIGTSSILRSEKEIMTLPLEELSWKEFEELCYLYYKAKGYKPRKTSEGADGGVDLIIFNRHHNTEVAIQIKHYKTGKQINVQLIRELDSAKKNHGCILAEMITSSRFTNPALSEADKRNIVCRGEEWVNSKLLPWREQQVKKKGMV